MFIIGLLGYLGIIYFVVSFIFSKMQDAPKLPAKYVVLAVGLVLVFASSFLVVVGAQEVVVMQTPDGVNPTPLKAGWHMVYPWYKLETMDKTVWVYTFSQKRDEGQKIGSDAIWAPTKDGIKMGFDVSVSWSIDEDFAPWIMSNVSEADGSANGRYLWIEENFIRAKAKSAIALSVSNYTPIECYSYKRQDLQKEAFNRLKDELLVYHLKLQQIDIREVFYDVQYEQSITNKKLQEQEALTQVEVTKQIEEKKKQEAIKKDMKILQAEGEAKALQITGQSISNNPKIIQLEWIKKWDGKLPNYMMGNGQGVIMNLNDGK